mgnify:CR=1 FL=1
MDTSSRGRQGIFRGSAPPVYAFSQSSRAVPSTGPAPQIWEKLPSPENQGWLYHSPVRM